ncbi:MAG TPA: radical SAM protein [Pyrinomonadaceae bacterium]|nr:radical SAM protein [Pyrinomonadaceae bacterium]
MILHDPNGLAEGRGARDYGPPRLIVELTNICNLHCAYCLRDEDALYHTPANFIPVELLRRVVREAREEIGASHVMFTGGETTLHPRFGEILGAVGGEGMKCSFVTNGWHFERVWPALSANREAVSHVAFSLDGATRESHDRWRGEGSFIRLVRAFARCQAGAMPFVVKVGIRKDTLPQLEQIALFAARMGATALNFGHLLPTSGALDEELALSSEERELAEQEIAVLARVFKMRISIEVGYYNTDPAPPCSALAGTSCNIDYRGRLSLCCNLSGFRGATGEADVVADLNLEGFAVAFKRLQRVAEEQMQRRRAALEVQSAMGAKPDLALGSPCLFCLHSFAKVPWQDGRASAPRALPVVQVV